MCYVPDACDKINNFDDWVGVMQFASQSFYDLMAVDSRDPETQDRKR